MLWDLIRDFFVQHVFGGSLSDGETFFDHFLGVDLNSGGIVTLGYQVGLDDDLHPVYLTLGDWLSTTATIISITIIVVLCCLFVYKIIKLIGGLIR